jgi:DNA-binding XRE family transcriptional regulator
VSALRAAFDEEREWLRDADDQRAVLDRIAGYRVNVATARRVGNAQAHAFAEHLVELAEDRLAELKALAWTAKERATAPKAPTRAEPPPHPKASPTPQPEPPARPASAPSRVDDSDVVRQLQAALAASRAAERRAAREREDADRRAREAREERDAARTAHRQGQSTQATPPPSRSPVGNAARLEPPATLPSAVPSARTAGTAKPTATATTTRVGAPVPPPAAARPANAAPTVVGTRASAAPPHIAQPAAVMAPPATAPEASPPSPAPTAAAGPALTGADLRAFRRGAGLTQVATAQRLGVTQGTISKAEGNPRIALGPALQEALRLAGG